MIDDKTVCVTSCYELEMLDEHTASGSLLRSINLQQNLSLSSYYYDSTYHWD